jgi:uncharacterized protein
MAPQTHRIPRGAIRIPVPDVSQQTDYSCGASCLEAICKYYGVGKEDEWQFIRGLHLDRRVGVHPGQIHRLARSYRLSVRSYPLMTLARLKRELEWRHPVMLMIQAYGQDRVGKRRQVRWRRDYTPDWNDGHWVVAIGFDREGVFFEDPLLQGVRGWLSFAELNSRWHDTGPHGKHLPHYGLAIWLPRHSASAYESRAERIP